MYYELLLNKLKINKQDIKKSDGGIKSLYNISCVEEW